MTEEILKKLLSKQRTLPDLETLLDEALSKQLEEHYKKIMEEEVDPKDLVEQRHDLIQKAVGQTIDIIQDLKKMSTSKDALRHYNKAIEDFETAYGRIQMAKLCI